MSNRRKRTIRDLCDATPAPSQSEITPILRGNIRMQGSTDEANCNMLTHMVTSENKKGFSSFSDRSQNLYCKGKSGTCNVCSTPCSSCFHANKVLIESNDESAGETCALDTETGQLSVLSTVGGMDSTADSRTENAAGRASSKTSNVSVSDDSVLHSKSEGRRSPEGHDDCLSCVSGTEEHANKIFDSEDSGVKFKKLSICGDISDKVSPASSQTRIHTPNSGVGGHSSMKVTDDATDLLKFQTSPQAPSGKNLSHDKKLGDVKDDKHSDTKEEPSKGSTEHLNSLSPNGAASDVCGDHPATALNATDKNDKMEVEVLPTDDTDDSDMVEQDVKVCDICGDAGREDLLAVCCRCSDGAEHTYCMREMQLKVPEGDWLCEDCKTAVEEAEKARQEKKGRMDKNEKNNSSGQASENLNSSDVEDRRMKSLARNTSKRFRDDDDTEVSSVAKKPALESIVGSPKTANSIRTASLSRESSFKNLDRSKLHSPHVSSPETVPVNDNTESAKSASDLRLHNIRGNFSKSNSFNSLNSKPKVKLVDKVIQRVKSAKEHSSFRLKDGAVRSIGKSMSFKSTNCSRSESKTKMLSPRPSHIQDLKNTKEKSTFERQRSFKTEHPSSNSIMGTSTSSRIDKRSASRVEPSSPTAVGSYHELKPVQADGKAAALSRSSSLAAWRTADISSSIGEFKRPSTHGHSTLGVASANGVNNTEQKNNQTTLKQESFPEKSALNANELPGGLPRPKDLADSGDRMRSGSRFGPSSVKSSRDESDNLKAALEAAALRKPGVYRKLRAPGQSDEPSIPTMGCEVASHQDHMSIARKKKLSSDAELPERPSVRNLIVDPLKEETLNNAKRSSMTVEGLSAGGQEGAPIGPFSGDVFRNMSAIMPLLLKSLAIPEHEYIWQGSFEICRGGQIFDSWDGIQAHLSTCASPKVTEAVKKFKSRIVLYEVPRLSTWPIQFQENGVREDNIGLFFFAKDLDSYIKIYKVLLDKMMRNDLALKGNIDGVELLIFPSNQLPDNLQRWNMLYYLWGVFRGKKESCLQQMPESNQYCAPQNIPAPIMSLPENRCSLRPIAENAREDADPVLAVPVSEKLGNLLTAGVSRDSGAEGSSLDRLDHGLSSNSSLVLPSDCAKECQEMKGTNQEGGISSICITPLAMRSSTSGRDQIQMQLDTSLSRQQSPHHPIESVASMPMVGPGEGTTLDKICRQNEVENQVNARDLSTSGEIPLEDGLSTRGLYVENSRWPFSHKESMHPLLPQPFYAGPSQFSAEPRNDNIHPEKMNHVPSGSAFVEPERRFFPVESAPVHDGSMSWKMHFREDRLRAPNLELALGAESTPPLTLGIEPLLINKVDEKVNEERILEEVVPKAEDDVSASLSLSLSFPFPEKELNAKPAPKAEQLMAQRKSVNNSSMLLFGKSRDDL